MFNQKIVYKSFIISYDIINMVIIMERKKTRVIKIKDRYLGGDNPILVQSMSTYLPRDLDGCSNEILRLEEAGCEIVRVAIKNEIDALKIKELKELIHIPLVADIHFDYNLGILAIENGVDAIRFNPGNIGKNESLKKLLDKAIEEDIPVRIGVNSGSINPKFLNTDLSLVDKAVESLKYYVGLCEEYGLKNIVLSIKMSSTLETIEAYEKVSKIYDYPLHLGVTEAGISDNAIIKSAVAMGTLLEEGIGDTIRVSITGDPVREVTSAISILRSLNLHNSPDLVSCPTCGRTEIDLEYYAKIVEKELRGIKKNLKVAVMGCLVNGPGEAREADLGVAFISGKGVMFKKGKTCFTGTIDEAIDELRKELVQYKE